MKTLQIIQITLSVLITLCILLQQKGSGLGAAFGGDSAIYSSRRGAEKLLFILTIVFSVAFVGVALALLVVQPA